MTTWNEILKELGETPSQSDYIRRKYIKRLSELTDRNVIIYYSGFLNPRVQQDPASNVSISDQDMEGFMVTIQGLNCSKGLDLLLHTPGGDPTATEAIVNYLKEKFGKDIRIIVPQIAMSAGTMIACCGKEIIMGKHSSLGPIDPQFQGIPAYNILEEFNEAKKDLEENPQNVNYWAIKLQQYPAAFMKSCIDAINLSEELIDKWLKDNMLSENIEAVSKVVSFLNNHDKSKNHGRHFNYKTCKDNGLIVSLLEDNQELQDAVLAVHYSAMLTLDSTQAIKIIENQNGQALINIFRN